MKCFFFGILKGVIVLSRQWKNMLYNPMLFEHQYKYKLTRPMNVTFAVPQSEEVSHVGSVEYFRLIIRLTSHSPKEIFVKSSRYYRLI